MAVSEPIDKLNASLAGRYEIQRQLGAGGMATVFLARDVRHRRPVAIKVLHPELAGLLGPERFLREIETAAALNHPHILPLHDSGTADGLLYYVMPYVAGESLRARLEREHQLPVQDALRLAGDVAEALDYAHRQGVIHRDIKPENILLAEQHALVSDFGIARAVAAAGGEKLTATGLAFGTPAYMSPEQAAGTQEVDGRSDQYSLACVLYEMLAGQPPFTGSTAASLVYQHLSVAPRPVTNLRPAVPEGVERVLERALAKTAADRFGTVVEFATAIGNLEPQAATESPIAAPRPPARRLWRLALVGAAVAVVAVSAYLLPHRDRPAPAPARPTHGRSEIAVLPFQNLSGDGPNAYFAGGLHEELLTQLAKLASLKVISRTSVMGYQGTSKPLRQIANELGVGSVVEGSVQVVGQRLRVNVQLIDAATDEHLWAESYDRTLDDAFAIESEVAQRIVEAVGAAFTSIEQRRLTAAPTANAEAYQLYLQGTEYLSRPGFRKPNLESAQQLFQQALALDSSFAAAHALLARAHVHLYWSGFDPSPARLERGRAEAMAALRLAPDLPEAHGAMAWVFFASRAHQRAVEEVTIALEGNPNDAVLWRLKALNLRRLGRWKETIAAFERAAQLAPRDADLFYFVGGHTYRRLRRYPEAARAYERALSLAPEKRDPAAMIGWTYFFWQGQLDSLRAILARLPSDADLTPYWNLAGHRAELLLYERHADSLLMMSEMARPNLAAGATFFRSSALYAGWAHRLRGDHEAARAAFDSARLQLDSRLREVPDDYVSHYARGMALAGLGRRAEALREARWLQQFVIYREDPWEGPDLAEERALILAQLGDAEGACDELGRLLAEPSDVTVHTLRLYPLWDPIREHPRFKALLAKYGSGAQRRGSSGRT